MSQTIKPESRKLAAIGLDKSFKQRKVVSGVDLEVRKGEIVGLLGPNGAGKTTSFYMMVGLISPDAGSVFIDDLNVTEMPVYMRARHGLGYLPQEPSIFRDLSVYDNLRLVLEERGRDEKETQRVIYKLMENFGLFKIANTPGYALSGGERRRVEIARVLAIAPDFILLDEPFSGIDPIAVYDIQQIILDLKSKGYGIMITDHNVRETLAIVDRTYLIHRGEIMVQGSPEEVAQSQLARKFYLGDRFSN